jgi:cell wall-associated NlpC family hydrolase
VGADSLSSDQAKATALEAQITQDQSQISALGQQYDQAQYHLEQINAQISSTKAAIATAENKVNADKANLRASAVDNYMMAGTQQSSNPLFASNQKTYLATTEYGDVANGMLATDVSNLTVSEDYLNTVQSSLQSQQAAAQAADNQAASALGQAKSIEADLQGSLSQVKGQIAQDIAAQKAAQDAAARANAAKLIASSGGGSTGGSSGAGKNIPNPPSNLSAGERAVQFAESQLGVPYVWGAMSPGSGFDCSGLVAWAWGQAGVSLPHYSGAQMSSTTPVPLSGLEPGDLLFFGPGGSEHVAMYVGGGSIIQAPYTGAVVSYDSLANMLAYSGNFAGAGRPY